VRLYSRSPIFEILEELIDDFASGDVGFNVLICLSFCNGRFICLRFVGGSVSIGRGESEE
jgi:hypothetical protein